MAKWSGVVGFIEHKETAPGVWRKAAPIERPYRGDVIRNNPGWQPNSNSTNDDLTLNSQLSIVADSFAFQHSHIMKYVEFMGVKWEISRIEPQRPRLLLTLGGLYNG
jgi:hypothetical protein